MAINRELNLQGQQRVDIPVIRMVESAVRYDFDALAYGLCGDTPYIFKGFEIVGSPVGDKDTKLTIRTAGSRVMHHLATDSGSVFAVPTDRANEVIEPGVNTRLSGGWNLGVRNYLGFDLVKTADSATQDSIKLLDSATEEEVSQRVPLARTLDYKFYISSRDFTYDKNLCPVAIVDVDVNGTITAIRDARPLFGRLDPGGSNTADWKPYGWPGGRVNVEDPKNTSTGDKSLTTLKSWMNGVMTRIQEVGGGQYWYSPNADRNVAMTYGASTFVSTGEAFEVVANNVHWKGVSFIFDNSPQNYVAVNDQLTDLAGLTNLADGECIYVDLDRTSATAVTAQRGTLSTLGMSARPGQRHVMVIRVGSSWYVKGAPWPIGAGFKLATTTVAGMLKSSVDLTIADPISATVIDSVATGYTATCGGISHNRDTGSAWKFAAADLYVGRGLSAGDYNIRLTTDNNYQTFIKGSGTLSYPVLDVQHEPQTGEAYYEGVPLKIRGASTGYGTPVADAQGNPVVTNGIPRTWFNTTNCWTLTPISVLPNYTIHDTAEIRYFVKSTKTWKAPCRVNNTESMGYYLYNPATARLTRTYNGALIVDGVTLVAGDRVLMGGGEAAALRHGIYVVIDPGTAGTPAILGRPLDADDDKGTTGDSWGDDYFDGIAVYISAGTLHTGKRYVFNCLAKNNAVDIDLDLISFQQTDAIQADQVCIMWRDGSYTAVATSPTYDSSI